MPYFLSLHPALRKIQHHDEEVWCGYLTPCEYLALVDAGAKPPSEVDAVMEKGTLVWRKTAPVKDLAAGRALAAVKKGVSNPCWFYFVPSPGILRLKERFYPVLK